MKNMNNAEIYRHGELILKPIESLPKGAVLSETVKNKIVAHSETGHHHVLESDTDFKIYTMMGDTFIEIPSIAQLRHEKTGKDVHKTHEIKPAIYKVVIKNEFNYFEGVLKAVRD